MSARLLGRLRVPVLVVAALVTAVFGLHASRLGIEHDNASLLSTHAADVRDYAEFKALFGSDEDILVAVAHPALLEAEGLGLLADLTREIGAMDGVRKAWSLVNAEELVPGEAGPEPRPLLEGLAGASGRVRAALDRNPDFTGWLVSADRRAAGILVEIEDRPADTAYRSRLVESLRGLAPSVAARGGELHLTGVPVQKIDVSAYVARDQRLLLPTAVVVLGLTLALLMRHVSGVAIPIAVAGLTVVWTTGLYSASGHATNAITALLPPVLLVVAMASTVHVYNAWLRGHGAAGERGAARDALERASDAVRFIFVPALLCAVTTAQGFLSLAIGDLPAVRQFGLFAAFGTVVTFVAATTVVPSVLSFLRPPPHLAADEHGRMLRFLDAASGLATRRPVAVLLVFLLATVALAGGIPRLRTNTDLIGFLREDAPLRRDTEWIDRNLAGTLPLDFVIRRGDGGPVLDLDTLGRLDALEGRIRSREHVAGVASIVAMVRQVNRAETGGERLHLPTDGARLQGQLDLLDESAHAMVRRFAAPQMTALRLTVRLHAVGTHVSAPLVAAIRADAAAALGPGVQLHPTGAMWEVVRDSEGLVKSQVRSFSLAIVLVIAAIGLLLRSVTFTLVAMIPNVVPILWTGGLMGYAGIELSTGTAMIASAVLGLVVDDTIHYLSYYRKVRAGGRLSAVEAVRLASRTVGAPVTIASVSLVLGFWVGALGSFLPTVYFSLLTGLTMITGMVCELLVLPASLVLLDRLAGGSPPATPQDARLLQPRG
ncbi:MAG: RND family transporter [Candidatus Binatia bacterium]